MSHSEKKMNKTASLLLLKAGVSLLILFGLFSFLDGREVASLLFLRTNAWYLFIGVICSFFVILLDAKKFSYAISAFSSTALPYKRLLHIWFSGLFFSSFLPGGQLTMEGTKLVLLKKNLTMHESIHLILLDKVAGLIALGMVTSLCLFADQQVFNPVLYCLLFFTISLFSLLLFTSLPLLFCNALVNRLKTGKIKEFLFKSGSFLQLMAKKRFVLMQLSFFASCCQLLAVGVLYCSSLALQLEIGFVTLGWVFGLVALIQLIPFSLAGLGIREASYLFFLLPYGIKPEEAVSLSLLLFALQLFFALIGGGSLLFQKTKSSPGI